MTIKELELLHKILLAELKRAEKSSDRAYRKFIDKLVETGEDSDVQLKEDVLHKKALEYRDAVLCLLHTFEHSEFKGW